MSKDVVYVVVCFFGVMVQAVSAAGGKPLFGAFASVVLTDSDRGMVSVDERQRPALHGGSALSGGAVLKPLRASATLG